MSEIKLFDLNLNSCFQLYISISYSCFYFKKRYEEELENKAKELTVDSLKKNPKYLKVEQLISSNYLFVYAVIIEEYGNAILAPYNYSMNILYVCLTVRL